MKTTIILICVFFYLISEIIPAVALTLLPVYILYRIIRGAVDPEWLAAQEQCAVDHSSDLNEED